MRGVGGIKMNKNKGFSLVELMVSMLLGLLITGAAMQLFLANQQTFALQQTLSRVQEDGQLFVRFLVSDLRRAGLEMDGVSSSYAQGVQFAQVQGMPGSSDGADFDRITVAYHGVSDCEGTQVAAMTEVVNTYFVNEDAELICDGNLTGGGGVALLTGVEAFEVMYGIDDQKKDCVANVSRYVSAGSQGGHLIAAVRFGLLLKEEGSSLPKSDGTKTHYILTKERAEPEDRAIRRVFMSTVKLRNYNWDAV